MKRFQENGFRFSPKFDEDLLDLLEQVTHWEAKLHLLQMLPQVPVPETRKNGVYRLLGGRNYLAQSNKLVRAWSYNGLAVLATAHAELRPSVLRLLEAGQQDDAASVRARIRNIVKNTSWTHSD